MNLEKDIFIFWLSIKQLQTISVSYSLCSWSYVQQLMLHISVFQSFPPILNNLMLSILLCCNSSVLNNLRLLLKEVVPPFDHHHGTQHREKPDTTKID